MNRIAPDEDLSVIRGFKNKYRNVFGMVFCFCCKNTCQKPCVLSLLNPELHPGLFMFEPFRLCNAFIGRSPLSIVAIVFCVAEVVAEAEGDINCVKIEIIGNAYQIYITIICTNRIIAF